MTIDGGLTALGGFLFQTVGALGLAAAAFQSYRMPHHPDEDVSNDLEALLGFANTGSIQYEHLDQDVSIRHILHEQVIGYILVQFKYSSLAHPPSIDVSQMKTIIGRLQTSEERAKQLGLQVIGYSLVTNRSLSINAQKLADKVRQTKKDFHIVASLPEAIWQERLQNYARGFGCTDGQIEAGIQRGVGALLQRVCNPRYFGEPLVTTKLLAEVFTGQEDTHRITPAEVSVKSQKELDVFAEEWIQPQPSGQYPLLERHSLMKHLSELVEQHAFVVLCGHGGNGKTATLWRWMQDSLNAQLPEKQNRYYHLVPGSGVEPFLLPHLLRRWAHLSTNQTLYQLHTLEQFLDRLEIARSANTNNASHAQPVFILGLDAIDEVIGTNRWDHVYELLMWFWEQELHPDLRTRATLIVTCRESRTLANNWFSKVSPFEKEANPFRELEVSVDTFSDDELVELASLHLPVPLAERFAQTHPASGKQLSLPTLLHQQIPAALHASSRVLQPVDGEVFDMLRHPILWSCLRQLDQSRQEQVLNGDKSALNALIEISLNWFCHKMRMRTTKGTLSIEQKHILVALHEVAVQCSTKPTPWSMTTDFISPASKTAGLTDVTATHLYQEALSAGLIDTDRDRWWRWRHSSLGNYLASQFQEEEEDQ